MRRFAATLCLLVACGHGPSATSSAPPPAPDAGSEAGLFSAPIEAGVAAECAGDTKDVFVMGEDHTLYSFDPPTLTFEKVGLLDCRTNGATPTSMAVDRFGNAWIRHSDASIWKVNPRDRSCEATKFVTLGETFEFYKFGMGFSKGGAAEELFLSDSSGAGLAKLDLTTMKIEPVGRYTGTLKGKTAELTGTGDGKLFGFFVTVPAQLAEISKSTGELLSTKTLDTVTAGDAWAFSFYGGDFYFYTHATPADGATDDGSDVTRYRPSDGSIAIVKPKVGIKIVGAGVSTCAPTEQPR